MHLHAELKSAHYLFYLYFIVYLQTLFTAQVVKYMKYSRKFPGLKHQIQCSADFKLNINSDK